VLQAHGVIPIAAGYKDSWTISWDLNPDLLISTLLPDPDWIAKIENGLASFADDPHFAGVLARFGERLAYTNPNPFDTGWNEALQMLAAGQAAMIVNGTWTVDGVKSIDAASNIGLFAFPSFNDPQLNKFAVKSTGGIVVNPKSPHKEAALQVLGLFSTPQVGKLFQQDKKAISVVKGLQPDFDPIYAEFTRTYLQPARTFDWSQISTSFGVNDSRLGQAYMNAISEFIVDKDHNVKKCIERLDQSFDSIRRRRSP
jgi:ABC-type glycerol-3-phosphate transport system substrate-binding protein